MTKRASSLGHSLFLLLACLGCERLYSEEKHDTAPPPTAANDRSDRSPTQPSEGEWITSNDMITVEDGKVTVGRPAVTEDVKREVYQALNHRRKMIASIRKNSGSSRGIQQMQEELDLLSRGYRMRYDLTQEELDEILEQGDANAWE